MSWIWEGVDRTQRGWRWRGDGNDINTVLMKFSKKKELGK